MKVTPFAATKRLKPLRVPRARRVRRARPRSTPLCRLGPDCEETPRGRQRRVAAPRPRGEARLRRGGGVRHISLILHAEASRCDARDHAQAAVVGPGLRGRGGLGVVHRVRVRAARAAPQWLGVLETTPTQKKAYNGGMIFPKNSFEAGVNRCTADSSKKREDGSGSARMVSA